MSHFELLDVISSHPEIPTDFICNVGNAIPVANELNIFAESVAAAGIPAQTVGSGNTVEIEIQRSSAQVSSSADNAGLCSFDSSEFAVDASGFVTTSGIFSETLTGNSGGAVGPTLGNINTIASGSMTVVGNPGTSTLTWSLTGLTNHYVMVGAGTDTVTMVSPSTTGFVLTSNGASSDPSFQALPSSAITWSDKSGNFNAATLNGYFCTAALTATLPASPNEGDTINFICTTTAIVVKANTGQTIEVSSTTSSSAGTATNVAAGDALTLVYRTSGTRWWALSSVGNWTLA